MLKCDIFKIHEFPVSSYRNNAAWQVVKLDAPSCSQKKLFALVFYSLNICLELH